LVGRGAELNKNAGTARLPIGAGSRPEILGGHFDAVRRRQQAAIRRFRVGSNTDRSMGGGGSGWRQRMWMGLGDD